MKSRIRYLSVQGKFVLVKFHKANSVPRFVALELDGKTSI
jgi:hypothetical protein